MYSFNSICKYVNLLLNKFLCYRNSPRYLNLDSNLEDDDEPNFLYNFNCLSSKKKFNNDSEVYDPNDITRIDF